MLNIYMLPLVKILENNKMLYHNYTYKRDITCDNSKASFLFQTYFEADLWAFIYLYYQGCLEYQF